MIPKFPTFSKLELSFKKEIESIASKYPPYSDFNFTNMWAWDIHGNLRVSLLNDNLVIIHENFRTDGKVYSFLGNNRVNDTLDMLFKYIAEVNDPIASVGLVPEESIKDIDVNKYFIEIDFDSCDYIYDLEQLATYPGNKFYKKRKRLTDFLRNYKDVSSRLMDLYDPQVQNSILGLVYHWANGKESDNEVNLLLSQEYRAISRFLKFKTEEAYCLGVYQGNKLIGFDIMLLISGGISMGLFIKYDRAFIGINEFIMRDSAEFLLKQGSDFVNGQEDLGIDGLRSSKNSYNPIKMLRKYSIRRF